MHWKIHSESTDTSATLTHLLSTCFCDYIGWNIPDECMISPFSKIIGNLRVKTFGSANINSLTTSMLQQPGQAVFTVWYIEKCPSSGVCLHFWNACQVDNFCHNNKFKFIINRLDNIDHNYRDIFLLRYSERSKLTSETTHVCAYPGAMLVPLMAI